MDIADSIVQTGREALESAAAHIEATHRDCRVVYGDTDSLFVLARGRSVAQAVRLGAQIAAEVTRLHPAPMKLKFEKVHTQ